MRGGVMSDLCRWTDMRLVKKAEKQRNAEGRVRPPAITARASRTHTYTYMYPVD